VSKRLTSFPVANPWHSGVASKTIEL
jgi:hypothetical protein